MRGFLERGGLWVGAQLLLLGAIVLLGRLDVATVSFAGHQILGSILIGAAVFLGVAAARSLGRNLTPYPKPVAAGSLIDGGPYRWVRHPMYTAVIMGMAGVAVRAGNWFSLALAVALVPFFYAKSTFEERHLAERYHDYGTYQQRVRRRLLPLLL